MKWTAYLPAGILTAGAVLTFAVGVPTATPLVRPLTATLPTSFFGRPAVDIPIGPDERRVSGVTDFYMRGIDAGTKAGPVSLYVGYHATQQGDNRMHSPSLCLPGSGWTPVSTGLIPIALGDSTVQVNRYILQRDRFRILVYYWFQGRGRVTAGEAALKLHAIADAMMSRRDEEALVRIVVPVDAAASPEAVWSLPVGTMGMVPDSIATQLARIAIPALEQSLPPAP